MPAGLAGAGEGTWDVSRILDRSSVDFLLWLGRCRVAPNPAPARAIPPAPHGRISRPSRFRGLGWGRGLPSRSTARPRARIRATSRHLYAQDPGQPSLPRLLRLRSVANVFEALLAGAHLGNRSCGTSLDLHPLPVRDADAQQRACEELALCCLGSLFGAKVSPNNTARKRSENARVNAAYCSVLKSWPKRAALVARYTAFSGRGVMTSGSRPVMVRP